MVALDGRHGEFHRRDQFHVLVRINKMQPLSPCPSIFSCRCPPCQPADKLSPRICGFRCSLRGSVAQRVHPCADLGYLLFVTGTKTLPTKSHPIHQTTLLVVMRAAQHNTSAVVACRDNIAPSKRGRYHHKMATEGRVSGVMSAGRIAHVVFFPGATLLSAIYIGKG
jgi:hypothetical protein